MFDFAIKNGLVYIDDSYKKVNIGVTGEKISYLGEDDIEAKEVYDASNRFVIPGLIDPHVHFALFCGTVTSRDDFYYGSKTAAYGGVTAIIDFLDPSRNAEELEKTFYERLALAKNCNIDYHFHACIREPNGDLEEYVLKMKELGMNTIKLFTTYSETHRRTYDKDIIELLKLSKKYEFLVCAHIENDEMIDRNDNLPCTKISEARSEESETTEAFKLCEYAKETGGNLYMVHCSSGRTFKKIIEQYGDYLNKNIFIESCPQYFAFNKDVLNGKNGYLYTFAPPLRDEGSRQLHLALFDKLSTVGTDHCSFMVEDKKNHPLLNGHPLGIGGIENSYVVMHKLLGDKVINKMSVNIAEIEKIPCRNGIKVGNFANFAIIKNVENVIGKPHGFADYSIYEGMKVDQKIVATILRGKFILKDDKFMEKEGQLINCD